MLADVSQVALQGCQYLQKLSTATSMHARQLLVSEPLTGLMPGKSRLLCGLIGERLGIPCLYLGP